MKHKELAQKYFDYHQKLEGKSTEEMRAIMETEDTWEDVHNIISEGESEAIELLEALCSISNDKKYLAYVGAGPFEDFLVAYGEEREKEIDKLIDSSDNALIALACVWKNSMSKRTWGHVQTLITANEKRLNKIFENKK